MSLSKTIAEIRNMDPAAKIISVAVDNGDAQRVWDVASVSHLSLVYVPEFPGGLWVSQEPMQGIRLMIFRSLESLQQARDRLQAKRNAVA